MRPRQHGPGREASTVVFLLEALTRSPYLEHSATLLAQRGWDVTVVGLAGPDEMTSVIAARGVRVVDLRGSSARDYPRSSCRLRHELQARSGGILHAMDDIPTVIGGAATRTMTGWRTLNHRHHTATPLAWYWAPLARRVQSAVMACSVAAFDAALADGVPSDRLRLAVNGVAPPRRVDAQEVSRVRRLAGAGDEDLLVVLAGRLRSEKGHARLLAAVERLPADLRSSTVVAFLGDGPLRDEVGRLVAGTPVRAAMLGYDPDVAPYYAAADVVAVPSDLEPFGLVAAEAMSYSRPVVASDVGGLREIIQHGISGVLVEPTTDSWCTTLGDVLRDGERRRRLGDAGRVRYEQAFTVEAMVSRWEAVYRELLDCPGGATRA